MLVEVGGVSEQVLLRSITDVIHQVKRASCCSRHSDTAKVIKFYKIALISRVKNPKGSVS